MLDISGNLYVGFVARKHKTPAFYIACNFVYAVNWQKWHYYSLFSSHKYAHKNYVSLQTKICFRVNSLIYYRIVTKVAAS